MANHQSLCLRRKSAYLEYVVYLDLWTHDLTNTIIFMQIWCWAIEISFIRTCPCIPEARRCPESAYLSFMWPWPLTFLTLKSNLFIFVPNSISSVVGRGRGRRCPPINPLWHLFAPMHDADSARQPLRTVPYRCSLSALFFVDFMCHFHAED